MKIGKCKKPVCNLHDKKNYVVHIRSLKQALNHELILKKVHRVIQFNQEAWLKPYIDMNTKLTKQGKTDFEKDFFKLMNNAVNVFKLINNADPNYHTTKWFSEKLLAIEMKKTKVKMNNSVYLGL